MKARLRVIRHADACVPSAADLDPGLSVAGVRQALGLPAALVGAPDRLVTSPLARARETALPMSGVFGLDRRVAAEYSELPWRNGQTPAEREDDIAAVFGARWDDLDPVWRAWRDRLIDRALSEEGDVVVISHFVAINVLVGLATGDDRTLIVHPANASVTEFALEAGGALAVVALGAQLPAFPSRAAISVEGIR